jgi:hypothetical protein
VFFLERLYFCFQFCFILFSAINGWTPTYFSWRSHTPFSCLEHSSFSLSSFNECSLFLVLHLAFVFCLCSYSKLVSSL